MPVQTDFMVAVEDRPGIAARVGEVLGRAGINITGVCGLTSGSMGILHVLIADEDAEGARTALEANGVEVRTERDVWCVECPDAPGELGRIMRRLADAGISCDLIYLSTDGELIIGAPEFERVVQVLGDRAIG